ncbi:hypothetical protein [Bradyrhizobium sp. HKCCYLRH1065]|uniref:hypothetical protein n=1 Tax=unclassified Bradyrhizobium TaxID=2631580 RepID=UPI003EBBE9AE
MIAQPPIDMRGRAGSKDAAPAIVISAIYIIMNGRTSTGFRPVENSAKAIAIRSLAMKSKREIQSYLPPPISSPGTMAWPST